MNIHIIEVILTSVTDMHPGCCQKTPKQSGPMTEPVASTRGRFRLIINLFGSWSFGKAITIYSCVCYMAYVLNNSLAFYPK